MAETPCIIGKRITVRGNLSGDEDLVIEGRVEGMINVSRHLTVASSGIVEANVEAEDLSVMGVLQGDVRATRSVALHASGRMNGTVSAPRFVIEDGAHFVGRVEMDVPLPPGLLA